MKIVFNLESLSLLIRENDIIDSLRNLQNHVNFFKSTLGNTELKTKVIDHIKKNFVKALTTQVTKAWTRKPDLHHELSDEMRKAMVGNYSSRLTLKDYLDLITDPEITDKTMPKFLLCLSIEGVGVDCRLEKKDMLANVKVKKILGMDLLAVDKKIKNFLELNSELKVNYSTRTIKLVTNYGMYCR